MSERPQVRPATPDDVGALTTTYNHYVETSHATFDVEPVTEQSRREWIARYAPTGRHRLLVAEIAGDVVGYATTGRFHERAAYDTSVQVSVYVAPSAQGRGVGAMLYTELFEAIRDEDVHRAYAGIALPNDASLALHRRFGFTEVGTYREVGRKFGRYWDVCWMERPLP
jgi:phosphinothricin acetyltransferase